MKKCIAIAILCIAGISAVSAAAITATITEIAGKVECKLPKADWKPAKAGDILPPGSLISTGFKSTAIITMESATLTVKPVTRLSIEELIKSEGTTKTQMFLMTGRVRAEITPKEGEQAEFRVKSPTATASVRGTGFEFDGYNLIVDHGVVQLKSELALGVPQLVAAGQFSTIDKTGKATEPVPATDGSSIPAAVILARNSEYSINTVEQSSELMLPDPVPITIAIGWGD